MTNTFILILFAICTAFLAFLQLIPDKEGPNKYKVYYEYDVYRTYTEIKGNTGTYWYIRNDTIASDTVYKPIK